MVIHLCQSTDNGWRLKSVGGMVLTSSSCETVMGLAKDSFVAVEHMVELDSKT